jgi:hypothetical protein
LIETTDFISFQMSPLRGAATRNKGMALFPRRINGKYAMIGRQDNENLSLIYSNDLYSWDGGLAILKPQFPWEFVQIGGIWYWASPIEARMCRREEIALVGGGNSAGQAAVFLSSFAAKIFMLVRALTRGNDS